MAVLEQHPGARLHGATDELARVTLLTLAHRDRLDTCVQGAAQTTVGMETHTQSVTENQGLLSSAPQGTAVMLYTDMT